jgi:hypothetical protein
VALATLCVGLATLLAAEHAPEMASMGWGDDRQPVDVLDVVLDRERLASLDILFDRPIGEGHVGEILGTPPATVTPALEGVWRWQGANVLRFEPAGRFAMATEYAVTLLPAVLLSSEQVLRGESRLTVKTDQFRVERVDSFEEPATDRPGFVILRADMRFNYPVNPEALVYEGAAHGPGPGRGPAHPPVGRVAGGGNRPEPAQRAGAQDARRAAAPARRPRDLTPAEGNVALRASYRQDVPLGSIERLSVRSVRSTPGEKESTVTIELSSAVRPEGAARFLRVKPAVKFQLGADRNLLNLTGPFRPGETYTLAVLRGLTGTDTSILPETRTERVAIMDLPPHFDFQSQGMFLAASGYRNLALESTNVSKVHLTVERVYLNNLFYLFNSDEGSAWNDEYWGQSLEGGPLGTRLAKRDLPLPGPRNRTNVTTLSMDDLIPRDQPGLYSIGLSRDDRDRGEGRGVHRWLLLTDLGLVAEQGSDEILVWARRSRASRRPAASTFASSTRRTRRSPGAARARTDCGARGASRRPSRRAAPS